MSSPRLGFREKLKGKIRDRSQEKHRRDASRPISTASSDHLSPDNIPQSSVPTPLSPDCQDTPIRELWNVAYERLREEDSTLIQNYELKLQGCLPAALGCVPSLKSSRREWMDTILKHKMQEMRGNIWKLTFGSPDIQPSGFAHNVLGVIKSANDYITTAASFSSYASLAWAGVGVLLPLFLNPIEQASALAQGLELISSLIIQSRMREDLYHRRYELNGSEPSPISKAIFRNTLEELYRQILRFQITSYCYFTHDETSRLSRDFAKRDDWCNLIEKIRSQDSHFIKISEIWRETQYNDECVAAQKRHQETINSLTVVGAEFSSLRKAVEDANAKNNHQDLMRWLCDIDPSPNYNTGLNRHEAGTSEWLLKSNLNFTTWIESPRSLIWLHGKAGSGKSILSSSVIKHLKDRYDEDSSVAIAYFYFSFSDLKKQERDGMLRSLIKQICCQRPNMPEAVRKLREYKGQNAQPPTGLLEQSLLAVICGFSATYIVIDALDECPKLKGERAELMKSLSRILTATAAATASNLHMFCTSRKESDIDVELRSHLSRPETAEINLSSYQKEMERDVSQYIDSTLSSANYNSWPLAIRAEVKGKLIEKSDGMFQYVRCQFDILQRLKSPAEIRRALNDLPQGLDETYERILRNIDPMYQTQVISCLKWLAFSLRILTIDELAEIFILRPEDDTIIDEDERIFSSEDILTYLHGLAIVEESRKGTTYVRFAHYSIKEYLTSDRICKDLAPAFSFTDAGAHLWIARSSLAYVLYLSVTCKVAENLGKLIDYGLDHRRDTLKWYTARNWPDHLEMLPRESWPAEVVKMATLTLSIRSHGLILTILARHTRYGAKGQETLQHPYYFTALSGYRQLTELLLSHGSSTSKYLTQEDMDSTLMCAARGGSKGLVQTLLERGADVNAKGISNPYWGYGSALREAISRGHSDIVRILLESGADINAQRGEYGSALQDAAMKEGLEMLELLISHGADIKNTSNAVLCTAASRKANTRHLEFLLANGADINMRGTGESEKTALGEAAGLECWSNFDLLLQRGADIRYGFPLHRLAMAYDKAGAVVRIRRLLEMGADPHAQCEELGTALHAACSRSNSIQVAQLLVDEGVDVNVVAGFCGTALQACASHGNIQMAEWLIAKGAIVNLQGGKYGNALQRACFGRHLDMVQLLLAHDAEVNAQGGNFGNALQAACASHYRDSTAIVRLLLERGADVNALGGHYGTALQAACAYRRIYAGDDNRIETARILLEYGANIHIQGGNYGSALHAAAAAAAAAPVPDSLNLVQLLLEHGADVNQVSGEFGTALHSALSLDTYFFQLYFRNHRPRFGDEDVAPKDLWAGKIQLLLENGADVNLMGGKYGFPLQSACAIEAQYLADELTYLRTMDAATTMVKVLLGHNPAPDVNAHSGTFGTALQAAAYTGQTESISLLLSRGAHVACHEWCGKYGTALNAAVIKGHWDIVHLLREAGAKPDCYSMQKPDQEWLLQVRQEHGPGAEERYRKFWELEKPLDEKTLLPRTGLLIGYCLSWFLIPFQLLIAFMTANFIRLKKREQR